MLPPGAIEEVVAHFRAGTLERLRQIEEAWASLVETPDDVARATFVARELHTLKGDARVMGFADIDVLANKLEELLDLGRAMRFRVSEEFDLAVTMGLRFIAMLVRKRAGKVGGIDLPGFLRQVEDVINSPHAAANPSMARTLAAPSFVDQADRISIATRHRLATHATSLFLEHLTAPTEQAVRLHAIGFALSRLVAEHNVTPLGPRLERHAIAAKKLARDLGKAVDVTLGDDAPRVNAETANAIDTALVHVLRNAVDHGIEDAGTRRAAGKPTAGAIDILVSVQDDQCEIVVEEDGRGIDLDEVRARAVELKLMPPTRAIALPEDDVYQILFRPGFSTRRTATDVSGRGVGLDAVKTAVQASGGTITVRNREGGGTRWVIQLPDESKRALVWRFTVSGLPVALAVGGDWAAAVCDRPGVELGRLLRLPQLQPQLGDDVFEFTRGEHSFRVATHEPPRRVSANRPCPTPATHPTEVIEIDGAEVLMLRPECL